MVTVTPVLQLVQDLDPVLPTTGTFQGSAAFAETGSLAIKRSISDPASASGRGSSQEDQRENPSSFRQDLSGLLEESSEVRRTSAVNPGVWQQKEEQQTSLQSTSRGWPVSAVDEKVTVFSSVKTPCWALNSL